MSNVVVVPSRTTPGEEHRVLIGIDDAYACTCPGYEFHGHCWAIEYVREERAMTNETTALVPMKVEPPKSILPSQDELSVIGTLAKTVVMAHGHAVPKEIDSPAKAAAVMLAGRELGVPPMSALRHIAVVNGKTEPDAQLMAGIIVAHEPDALFEVIEQTEDSCTVRFTRPSRGRDARWEYTYSLADAKRAQLADKGGWKTFPKDMMRWAAIKRLARTYAPDLINGVGTIEVGAMGSLVASEVDSEPETHEDTIDVAALPERALYAEGDGPSEDEAWEPPTDADDDGVVEEVDPTVAWQTTWDRVRPLMREATDRFTVDGKFSSEVFWAEFPDDSAVVKLRGERGKFVTIEPSSRVATLEVLLAVERELTEYLAQPAPAEADAQQPALVE